MEYSLSPAIYALFIAFITSAILCPVLIPYLTRLKFGQYVRSDGVKEHLRKAGTPTMGGIVILLSLIPVSLFFLHGNREGVALVLATVGFGLIGFVDDFISIKKHRSLGLRAYQKFTAQTLVAVAFATYCYFLPEFSTHIIMPFAPHISGNIGVAFIPLATLVMLGAVNGANFTDGLDGLEAGVTIPMAAFFMFVAWSLNSPILPITGAVIGSLMGFLLFNCYPARVFMGDTGSLALGGFVAGSAILLGVPLWLGIVAFIYVIEVLSVIIQVLYFKATGGKRFFKMAPIHHSFELSGWPENRVVALFCTVTILLSLLGYLAFNPLIM
ncbi:MAG: phospho-N-acetylmuramoyl-pentapeptide-transferase [Firmicutes bacterium]|nr:phospho-N-acetylmuramoyl-pentapeptide-transferase [Bacillota bacterium]